MVVKLGSILLIISSFFFFPKSVLSQIKHTDTAAFKKEFEQLLKKYNIDSKRYSINVTSINQKGGQTALVITNNYINKGAKQRHVTNKDFEMILASIQHINDSIPTFNKKKIEIFSLPLPESQTLAIELQKKLKAKSFEVNTHYNLVGTKELNGNYDIMPGNSDFNCVVVIIQPSKVDGAN